MSEARKKADQYAQAILEAAVERWQETLTQVSDALSQNPSVRATLEDTSQELNARLKALQDILPDDVSKEVVNFLSLLVQEEDLEHLSEIPAALGGALQAKALPLKADVVSAVELSDVEKEEIRRQLTTQYGEGLIFNFRVDPSLLGGLRVRVGDQLIDNSVSSRLSALREVIAASMR